MKKHIVTIPAQWDGFERRPTWGYVSVQEVARILNISPQSVHNWVGRGQLPPLEKKPGFRGNKRFFQIARLRSFLEGQEVDDIHWEWINTHLNEPGIERITQAQTFVKCCHKLLGVEKA